MNKTWFQRQCDMPMVTVVFFLHCHSMPPWRWQCYILHFHLVLIFFSVFLPFPCENYRFLKFSQIILIVEWTNVQSITKDIRQSSANNTILFQLPINYCNSNRLLHKGNGGEILSESSTFWSSVKFIERGPVFFSIWASPTYNTPFALNELGLYKSDKKLSRKT